MGTQKSADTSTHAAPRHAPLEWDTPMYRLAVDQLDQPAEQMNLDPNIWERVQQFFWSEEEVNRKLIDLMQSAYRNVEHLAKEKGVTLCTAALMRGIGRVKEAKHVRGVFP